MNAHKHLDRTVLSSRRGRKHGDWENVQLERTGGIPQRGGERKGRGGRKGRRERKIRGKIKG